MATGIVKFFNATRGYGFICPDVAGEDVFVHITEVDGISKDDLREGSPVEFVAERGRGGRPCAKQVRAAP